MSNTEKNLVLIGMPGSGKSTIGVILAKKTSRDFIDTDVLIQSHEHRSLQDIVDNEGYMKLREIEEKWVMALETENSVIATGGSVVYSDLSMQNLSINGLIIFLYVSLETLKKQKRCMSAFKQQPHQMLLKQCQNDCQNDSQIVQKWS